MQQLSNIFVIKTNKDLFISTGKIATRTLETIPNSIRIQQPHNLNPNVPLKNNCDHNLISHLNTFKLLNSNYKINFIIRYPWYRFTSGLFEIVGKSLMYIFSEQLKKYYKQDVIKIIPMFYDTDMWLEIINNALVHIPKFNKYKTLSSNWLTFHLENWLTDVEHMVNNIESNIIDLDDLSLYLSQNQYEFNYMNRSIDAIITPLSKEDRPSEWKSREQVIKNIDPTKMIGAFRKAVSLCDRAYEFLEYISDENEIYKKLIARRLVVNVTATNLKVF